MLVYIPQYFTQQGNFSKNLDWNPVNRGLYVFIKESNYCFIFQATCRCPKNLLYWPATDRCYPEHSRGPCEINQYLKYESKVAICQQTKICENGWIFWPPLQDCFQLYTQGPCHKVWLFTNFKGVASKWVALLSLKLFFKARNCMKTLLTWTILIGSGSA